jgi:hypothetical protein
VTVGASGEAGVIKIYIVPIIGKVAIGAFAGPMAVRRLMARFAIGIAGMVKNNVVPTAGGNVAGRTSARVVITGRRMAYLTIANTVVIKVNIVPPGRPMAV